MVESHTVSRWTQYAFGVDLTILLAFVSTFVGALGLVFTWLLVRNRPVSQPAPAEHEYDPFPRRSRYRQHLPSYGRAPRIGWWVAAALIAILVIIGTLTLTTPTRRGPGAAPTVTVTVTATPSNDGQAAKGGGGADYTALIAAIGAMIAGLGTAASGAAALIALKRKD